MTALDPARREELMGALVSSADADRAFNLIATWLAEARADGAAEVRARVEEVVKPQWRAVPPNVLDTESTLSAFRAGRNWVLDQLRAALTPPDTT